MSVLDLSYFRLFSTRIDQKIQESSFRNLSQIEKFEQISQEIYLFLKNLPTPCFALPALLAIIKIINDQQALENSFSFSHFEMWLNRTKITRHEQLEIRSKISGRKIRPEEYLRFFPLSTDKKPWGSHLVTAHNSPDLDTAVASFWGWLDAFAAQVGTGRHLWNLPGGDLSDQDASLFLEQLGSNIFTCIAKSNHSLSLRACDLLDPKGPLSYQAQQDIDQIEVEQLNQGAIFVDEWGYYQGDWRQTDTEQVKQVIGLFNNCLVWFESQLYARVLTIFALPKLNRHDLKSLSTAQLSLTIEEMLPLKDYTILQRKNLDSFLQKILGIEKGIQASMNEIAKGLADLDLSQLHLFSQSFSLLECSPSLFDPLGEFIEERPTFMKSLDQCFQSLTQSITELRDYTHSLVIAMRIKNEVLNLKDECVFSKAEVEEIKQLMTHFSHLTVVYPEKNGRLIPLGVIQARSLQRQHLGTVSLRDFSNKEEVFIAAYLEVISIIDHHKTDIKCSSPSVIIVSDAQSCNTLVAEQQLEINDRYSLANQTLSQLHERVRALISQISLSKKDYRLLQRVLTRLAGSSYRQNGFYVDGERERMEYEFYLHAILDDTDLLAKASLRDLYCVINLMNRLQTLETKEETEILNGENLLPDELLVKSLKERILQHPRMHKLYSQIYFFKERSIMQQIELYVAGLANNLFCDTKIQNSCARVGQLKLTTPLISSFEQYENKIREAWLKETLDWHQTHSNLDLFIQMISTIAGAKEVFENKIGPYQHQDQLWLWCPNHERAIDHLIHFFRGFRYAKELEKLPIHAIIYSQNNRIPLDLLEQHFIAQTVDIVKIEEKEGFLIVLKFAPSKLNSRKAVISPYLPSSKD
jgi:hypothetical protein